MKRTKIALALSMCVLCLGMLAFAVYSAVTSARFNLNGTINFNPEGVYVDIEGKVLRGSSRTDLVELTGDNFTYKDRNYDDRTGETSGNFTMTSWSPEVAFLPSERFIQYQVTITNKSGEPITAIPSDITAITDVTATEEVSAVLRIEPGETKTYKLTLESTGDTAITDAQVALNFDIRTTSAYVEEQTSLGAVTFTQNNGTITAVSGDNSTSSTLSLQKALFIPETIDSTTITEYGSGSSISLSSNIKFLIYEANIVDIGDNAFTNCTSLTNIGLPISLTILDYHEFENCTSLTNIELPRNMTTISGSVFLGCSSLESIYIPSSITTVSGSAFSGCSLLQITVASDNMNYSSDNGSLYNKDQTELIRGAGGVSTVNILDTVTNIGGSAFDGCSGLTNITIPSSVTSIEGYAFSGCTGLTNITIPSSVTSISGSTFIDCTNLTSLTINTKDGYVWQGSYNGSEENFETMDLSDPVKNASDFKNYGYSTYVYRQVAA